MATHHVVRRNGHELRIWGLKAMQSFPGLECETCGTEFTIEVLRELAEVRALKNIGTADTYCCTLPPTCTPGATSIRSLLTTCGVQTATPPGQGIAASPAPKDRIYRLNHRRMTFRMHGITPPSALDTLACCVCKREFSLRRIIVALDRHIDAGSTCRDFTCCKAVEGAHTGVMNLRASTVNGSTETGAQPAEPKPVCRWCKGTGRVTLLTTSKPCDCVKQENIGKGAAMMFLLDAGA